MAEGHVLFMNNFSWNVLFKSLCKCFLAYSDGVDISISLLMVKNIKIQQCICYAQHTEHPGLATWHNMY